MNRSSLVGAAACATAALLWASNATVARTAIDRGVEPLELTEVRALGAFLAFSLISLARRGRVGRRVPVALPHEVPNVSVTRAAQRVRVTEILAFGSAIAVTNLSYFIAIERLPIAIAIVVQYTAPALVVAYVAIVERRRPSRALLAILAIVMLGVALTADVVGALDGTARFSGFGLLAAAVSAAGFATYNVLAARVTTMLGAVRAHAAGFGVATLIWVAVQAPRGIPRSVLDASLAPRIAWVALAGTVLAFGIYALGVSRIGASSATIISTLEPVATVILGAVVLHQRLDLVQTVGAALVLIGVARLGHLVVREASP